MSDQRIARSMRNEGKQGRSARQAETLTQGRSAPAGPAGPIAEILHRLGGEAGIALLAHGRDAFALRAATARTARRSLDLQYYVWNGDLTGRLLAGEVLRAADRGVHVRLLLDDAFALGRERVLSALDAHPDVEVRLFNGTRWRAFGRLGFTLELLLGSWHLNRRMHNKCWIADGGIAIAGGRNIGNEYFDAADDFNFRDMDLVFAGQPVEQAVAVFERYWHSPLSRSAGELSAARDARGGLPALRRNLSAASEEAAATPLLTRVPDAAALVRQLDARLERVGGKAIRVAADPPAKAKRGLRARRLARAAGGIAPDIADALRSARREVLLISPYFVPGAAGLSLLTDLARRGVVISIVTNSLAATDVVAVHGGYARYRRPLLEAGIELFELKRSGDEPASVFGSRGASLHTKAFVIDDGPVCVGSFNLDPRSALLNTEMAVFADHPTLAHGLRVEYARLADPCRSWRVSLAADGGTMRWTDTDASGAARMAACREPGASLSRRALAWLTRLLPVESQL